MPLRTLADPDILPALDPAYIRSRPAEGLGPTEPPPRILLLYGSLRERSFSRLATEEAARLLRLFGAETRIFDPSTLPLPDQIAGDDHPAVHELLGRWMRMFTIPNQSSVAMAYKEFDEAGRMKPSSYYDRIVDVMEELVRFTVLLRPHAAQLVDRYSERKQAGIPVDPQTDLSSIAIAR